MRPTRDQWALELATVTAKRATCLRRAVGCVLLNARGQVLATGYNGNAAELPHCNEEVAVTAALISGVAHIYRYANACPGAAAPSGTALDSCDAVHAEQNALLQCRDVWEIETAYVTVSPCTSCVKLLLNTGCKRVVFGATYPDELAEALWKKSGRVWIQASAR